MTRNPNGGLVVLHLTAAAVAGALAKWFLVWLAQRTGGAEVVGAYSLIFAVGTPLFVAAQLGLRTIFLTKITTWPWSTYIALRTIGIGLGALILLGIVYVNPQIPLALGVAVISMKIFDSTQDLYLARIQYGNRLHTLAFISLLGAILSSVFAGFAAIQGEPFSIVVSASALGSLLGVVVAARTSRTIAYEVEAKAAGYLDILRASIPVTVAQLLASLLTYLPVVVMNMGASLSVVGVYAATAYVLTAADLVGSSIAKAMITPLRNVARHDGIREVVRHCHAMAFKIVALSLPCGVALVVLGNPFFTWIYGAEFALSTPSLALFALAATGSVVSHAVSMGLNVLNRYSGVTLSFGLACAISLVTGLIIAAFEVDWLITGPAMAAAGAMARAGSLSALLVSIETTDGGTDDNG